MQATEFQKKLATRITLSRILMVPVILAMMWPNSFFWNAFAAIFFILASLTDYFDGYYARKYNSVSNYGKFMDPIADKILVTSVLAMMLAQSKIDPWMVILILSRDNFISGIRSIAAVDQLVIAAKAAGKWKTAMQMLAIPLVIVTSGEARLLQLYQIGYIALWISAILSLVSGIQYYVGYLKSRKKE